MYTSKNKKPIKGLHYIEFFCANHRIKHITIHFRQLTSFFLQPPQQLHSSFIRVAFPQLIALFIIAVVGESIVVIVIVAAVRNYIDDEKSLFHDGYLLHLMVSLYHKRLNLSMDDFRCIHLKIWGRVLLYPSAIVNDFYFIIIN